MSKYLKLEIPTSCHEDWHTMPPEERGRFCLSCQKKVVDFTHMSDRELTQFFQQANGSTCGRFTTSQLNRDMAIPRKPLPWIKYFFQATLPAFLLSLKASTQITKSHIPVHISSLQQATKQDTPEKESITVEGTLQDEQGNSIPYATIMLKGTNHGVQADSAGKFTFKDIKAPATLVISSVGFMSQEVQVHPGLNKLQLKLQMSSALMGEVVVVGYAIPKKSRKKDRMAKAALQEEKSRILAYPNPLSAGNNLSIQCTKLDYGSYNIQLFNAAGIQVHSEKVDYVIGMNSLHVQLPQLAAGNYYMKLTHDKKGNSYTEQVVITL